MEAFIPLRQSDVLILYAAVLGDIGLIGLVSCIGFQRLVGLIGAVRGIPLCQVFIGSIGGICPVGAVGLVGFTGRIGLCQGWLLEGVGHIGGIRLIWRVGGIWFSQGRILFIPLIGGIRLVGK